LGMSLKHKGSSLNKTSPRPISRPVRRSSGKDAKPTPSVQWGQKVTSNRYLPIQILVSRNRKNQPNSPLLLFKKTTTTLNANHPKTQANGRPSPTPK
jgi:hypothetical protein